MGIGYIVLGGVSNLGGSTLLGYSWWEAFRDKSSSKFKKVWLQFISLILIVVGTLFLIYGAFKYKALS